MKNSGRFFRNFGVLAMLMVAIFFLYLKPSYNGKTFVNAQQPTENVPTPIADQRQAGKNADNDDAGLLKMVNEIMITVDNKYANEITNVTIKYNSLTAKVNNDFNPDNLSKQQGINIIRNDIMEYRNFLAERTILMTNYRNDLNSEISKYDSGPSKHTAFLDSLKKSIIESENLLDSSSQITNQILDVMQKIVDSIANNLDQVKVINNNIVFNDSSLNQQYTALMLHLTELTKRENEISLQIQNKEEESINKQRK